MFLSLSPLPLSIFSLSFTSFYLLLFTSFYPFFIGFIFFFSSILLFSNPLLLMLKIPEKITFISEIVCSIVINCLLMVPFLCLSFTLSSVWWVDPSHSLCLLIHLYYIIYYDLTVSCAASIDSHSLVFLSQTLIPHPCLIKLSIKQELFSWLFYNILFCFSPQVYVKMFRYTQMGDLNLLTKIIRNYFYFSQNGRKIVFL